MEFIESNSVILALVLIVLVICFISSVRTQKKEAFSDYINLERFNDQKQLNKIEEGVQEIQKDLKDYQDMSKYELKSEKKPQEPCRVNAAVDRDNYISKTQASKDTCPVPDDYDPNKYILKTLAQKPQSCPACPTIDHNKYVLKSTLPVDKKCPDCHCPKVKVSAGLCRKCPKCPTCPPPKPCPVAKCPEPKPCPPQKECPKCPEPKQCPVKICPACPTIPPIPEGTPCPKCCDREVIKLLKKTIYVDQNGNQIKSDESVETVPTKKHRVNVRRMKNHYSTNYTTPNATTSNSPVAQNTMDPSKQNASLPSPAGTASSSGEHESDQDRKQAAQQEAQANSQMNSWLGSLIGQGLATPAPTPSSQGAMSTSLSGSLEDQSNADSDLPYTQFPDPTEDPLVQTYNVQNEQQKQRKCKGSPFNHEFKQFGVYGRNQNNDVSAY